MKYFLIFLVLIAVTYSVNDVYAEEKNLEVDSTHIQMNEGKIQWDHSSYSSVGTGVVQVVDSDMNLNPEKIDNFDVDVWSDTDFAGIDLTVTETDDSSGIFEGTVFFSTNDDSSGHRLRVSEGDTIHSKYEDKTLPKSNTSLKLVLIGTASIDGTTSSSVDDRITLDKKSYSWGDKVHITIIAPESNLDNNSIEKIIPLKQSSLKITTRHFEIENHNLVEIGVDSGIFAEEIMLGGENYRDGISNEDDGISVFFEYEEDKVAIGSAPIIGDSFESVDATSKTILAPLKQIKNGVALIEIQCNEGKHVVYKRDRMKAACVTPETENHLIKRGWAALRLGGPATDNLPRDLCGFYQGKWIAEHKECELLENPLQCSLMGGVYDECSSACRNDPNYPNVICTDNCVEVCKIEFPTLEDIKNHPLVAEFYSKYPDAYEAVRDDHVSYVVESDGDFKVRMNLYFNEDYTFDYANLKCYVDSTLEDDVAGHFISRYLKDYECEKYQIPPQPEPEPEPIPEEYDESVAKQDRYISPFDEELIHEFQEYHTVITGKVIEWYGQKQPSKYDYQYRVEALAHHTPRMQDDSIYKILGNEDNFIPVNADVVLFGLDIDDEGSLYIVKTVIQEKPQP